MTPLLLLACMDSDSARSETGLPGETAPESTTDPLPYANPPSAEDLDPDPNVLHVRLQAAPRAFTLGPAQGFPTETAYQGYAYNGQSPGPTLRAKLGDTLIVELENGLEAPTTVHWHGLDLPWEMDGATWQLEPIAPGGSFTYTFPLTRAGTFWYHPHFDSDAQVDLGLYGALIVEDPTDPPVARELVMILDSWGEWVEGDSGDTGAEGDTGGHGMGGDHGAHSDGLGWTVNGLRQPKLSLEAGGPVRVRLINASNAGYAWLTGAGQRQIASDQGLLAALHETDSLLLAPGDRAELEWLPGAASLNQSAYSLRGGAGSAESEPLVQLSQPATAEEAGAAWPFTGTLPTPDPGTTDAVWVFFGSDEGGGWSINGEVFPEVTVPEATVGAPFVAEVRNLSATEHPFHLHGVRFEVLSVNGEAPALQTLEDTVNVPIYGVVRLRVVPTEPGDWMAHCHILDHAEGGMMTLLRVKSP